MIITLYDRLNIARSSDFKTERTQGIASHYGNNKAKDGQVRQRWAELQYPLKIKIV